MSIGWGQGKVEIQKHWQEIVDLLASGWTVNGIFLHLRQKGFTGGKATFYRAVKTLRARDLPAPVDVAPHSQTARTRTAKTPRPVALAAPSNSALPSSAGSAPAEDSALPAGDFAVPLSEPAPGPAPFTPELPRAHSSLEDASSGFQKRAFSDNEIFGESS